MTDLVRHCLRMLSNLTTSALNIAANDYEFNQTATAYSVAESLGFKLIFSFDMTGSLQIQDMVNLVATYASSSATYLWNGAVLVSTFEGEASGPDFWASFKSQLASQGVNVSFAPAFISYRDPSLTGQLLQSFPAIDGFFNWWSWLVLGCPSAQSLKTLNCQGRRTSMRI